MNLYKLVVIMVIVIVSAVACDNACEVVEKGKKLAIEAQDQATGIINNAVNTASVKMDEATSQMTNAVNNAVLQAMEKFRMWIVEALTPFFPWIFIIFFLLLFGALKAAIPFSDIVIIQIPILLISYIFSFILFAKIGLTAFAIKGTFWFMVPIIMSCIFFYLFRNTIMPKIMKLNSKISSKFSFKTEVVP